MSTDRPTPADGSSTESWALPEERQRAPRRRRRASRVLAVIFSLMVLAVLALYGVGYLMAGDKLPKNARVAGIAVGGLDRSAAVAKVTEQLSPQAERPILVDVHGKQDAVAPAAAGLTIDYTASVNRAGGGRSLDPRQIWGVLTGGTDVGPVIRVEQGKLRQAVDQLAERHDRKPRDAALAYRGARIKQTKARTGVAVQRDQATTAVRKGYLGDGAVTIPVRVTEPSITAEELTQVVDSFAAPAVSAPVEVSAGRAGSFLVTPKMIGRSVTFVSRDGTLAPELDAAKLRRVADPAVQQVELTRPRDATVRLVEGRPRVIPAVDGTGVSAADLAAAVQPALPKTGADRRVSVRLSGAKAKFSTADAEQLGVRRVTGSFTTYFPYAPYRNVNIPRAAELINNTLLKPGEVFSLNRIVGERTRANGFVEGFIITGGKFRRELGGGVSQSATTTFNAMFFAGLKDIEHQPHTLYVDRYPAGREATVAWPNLDLKFGNDTKYGVLVQASTTKAAPGRRGSITVKMWSTKTWDDVRSSKLQRSNFTTGRDLTDDSPKCEPMQPVPGFDVNYSRLFYRDGAVVKRERFFWRYAPTDRVRCI